MKFKIDPAVAEKYPEIVIGLPIIMGFDNGKTDDRNRKSEELLKTAEKKLQDAMTGEKLFTDRRITSYFDIFRSFGSNPKKIKPTHYALADRVLQGGHLPNINPIVNIYNSLSLIHVTPFGGEDLDTLYGDFTLSFACGGEQWIGIGGSPEPCVQGELIWSDDYDVSTRSLNWRQCERTKLTERSTNGYFIMDGFGSEQRSIIESAGNACIETVTSLCGGTGTMYWLDAEHPEVLIPYETHVLTPETKERLDKTLVSFSHVPGTTAEQPPTLISPKDAARKLKVDMRKTTGINKLTPSTTDLSIMSSHLFSDETPGVMGQMQHLMSALFHEVTALEIMPVITRPEFGIHGDYTTNAAMIVAKQLGKAPRDIALQVVQLFDSWKKGGRAQIDDQTSYQKDQTISDISYINLLLQDVDRLEIAGPGFINIYLTERKVSTQAFRLLTFKDSVKSGKNLIDRGQSIDRERTEVGRQKSEDREQRLESPIFPSSVFDHQSSAVAHPRVMMEFAHPNTHKQFHIGHLRNITTGECMIRLLESQGIDVIRANYQGDVGMHIAKALWGIWKETEVGRQKSEDGNQKTDDISPQTSDLSPHSSVLSDLSSDSVMGGLKHYATVNDRVVFLGKAYTTGSMAYEAGGSAKSEIETINKMIYAKDPLVMPLYSETRQWSLDYFQTVYSRVGTTYDRLYFESETYELGRIYVQEGLKKGIFELSDDAVIFPGEKYGLHNRVFITKEGNPTYEAKDMGLGRLQMDEYHPNYIVHCLGPEQVGYLEVASEALAHLFPDMIGTEFHLVYGWVKLKDGKMSSRTGQVVLGMWLLDETEKEIRLVMEQSKINYTKDDLSEVSQKLSVAAVKYSFLRVSLPQEIAFDLKASISISGDSGPYLVYTYARCKSVLRKAGIEDGRQKTENGEQMSEDRDNEHELKRLIFDPSSIISHLNSEERALARQLMYFPEIVAEATRQFSPNILCQYLYQLASLFNAFYGKHHILEESQSIVVETSEKTDTVDPNASISRLNPTSRYRLSLTASTAETIKQGLYLLGIETVERM